MIAYHLYSQDDYESPTTLDYYLNKETAEKEKRRLVKIQERWNKIYARYNELCEKAEEEDTEEPDFPNYPKNYISSCIYIDEITIIEK